MKEQFNPISEEDRAAVLQFDTLEKAEKNAELDRLHTRALLENTSTIYEKADAEQEQEMHEDLFLATEVMEAVQAAGGTALVVGGYARDMVLKNLGHEGIISKDLDIEVYGIPIDQLKEIVSRFGKLNIVGEQFAVIMLGRIQISIPRKDSKTGPRHKDFVVMGDPFMSIKEAARRRDFTVNALAWDPFTGEIFDQWGGIDDLEKKILRATDPKLFVEDAIRVLRAMQFVGRFGFTIEEKTRELCRSIDLSHLPKERIRAEWIKLLTKSPKPSVGLEAARDLGILEKLHPELQALVGVPQEPEWHPEGDVWTHNCMTVDAAAEHTAEVGMSEEDVLVVLLAALCHDLGKATTTIVRESDGRIISHAHDAAGAEPTERLLESMGMDTQEIKRAVINTVVPLVREHLWPSLNRGASDAAIRRLSMRLRPATIQQLVEVSRADHKGRALPWDGYPQGDELLARAESLKVLSERPKPILQGRDLLDLGMRSGPSVGAILAEIFQLQLDGKAATSEGAKNIARVLMALEEAKTKEIPSEQLLNGEVLTKDEMIDFVKSRLINEGVHDMGTLTMFLLLKEEQLPLALEKNKQAILTAHKYGPIWFSHLDRGFYEEQWKSFYGRFEADKEQSDALKLVDIDTQTREGLSLILSPQTESIVAYNEALDIKPEKADRIFALFIADQYPFEAGMFAGHRIMVQFNSEKKRLAVSILDEDTNRVALIDAAVRKACPEFAAARRVGYLFAADATGQDNVFSREDAERVYETLRENLKEFEK
jgi:tRNA nucleotidyltransferase (CCA-adding enzyme)